MTGEQNSENRGFVPKNTVPRNSEAGKVLNNVGCKINGRFFSYPKILNICGKAIFSVGWNEGIKAIGAKLTVYPKKLEGGRNITTNFDCDNGVKFDLPTRVYKLISNDSATILLEYSQNIADISCHGLGNLSFSNFFQEKQEQGNLSTIVQNGKSVIEFSSPTTSNNLFALTTEMGAITDSSFNSLSDYAEIFLWVVMAFSLVGIVLMINYEDNSYQQVNSDVELQLTGKYQQTGEDSN